MATRLEIVGEGRIDAASLVADFPGPAAWLGRGGAVRAANAAGHALIAALSERRGLAGFAAARAARTEAVTLPGEPAQALELAVVPIADGVVLLGHDLSLAANLRSALVDSRRRYKDLVEVSSDFAWETNAEGRFDFVSPRGALGFAAASLIGRAADSLVFAMAGLDPAPSPFATRRPIEQVETWLVRADGEAACVLVSAVPIFAADGAWAGARGVWHDVTEDRTWRAALDDARNREQMLAHIVRTIRDEVEPAAMLDATARTTARALGADGARIWRLAPDGDLALAASFGAESPAGLGDWAQDVIRAGRDGAFAAPELPDLPARMLAASAGYRHTRNGVIAVWRLRPGGPAGPDVPDWSGSDKLLIEGIAAHLGIALAQVAQHEQLAALARTDGLTGLVNARTFRRILARRLEDGRGGALVYVDLDNFKLVNDRHGHERGDAALQALALNLIAAVRADDVVARIGGDEFALWMDDVDRDAVERVAARVVAIREALLPFAGSPERPLGLSVGCVLVPRGAVVGDSAVLARADAAMYRVKRAGKGNHVIESMGDDA